MAKRRRRWCFLKRSFSASSHGSSRSMPHSSARRVFRRQECSLEARAVRRPASAAVRTQAFVCSPRRPVSSAFLALQQLRWSHSQVPREPLLWQIPFGFTRPRGGAVGAAWHGPPLSHVRSNLQTAQEGASAQPWAGRCYAPPPLSAGIGRLSPADLPASGEMWKVRDKNGLSRRRGSFLVQKGRKYLCGILFFSPPSSSKKYKETLSLMRMSALNLLGLD